MVLAAKGGSTPTKRSGDVRKTCRDLHCWISIWNRSGGKCGPVKHCYFNKPQDGVFYRTQLLRRVPVYLLKRLGFTRIDTASRIAVRTRARECSYLVGSSGFSVGQAPMSIAQQKSDSPRRARRTRRKPFIAMVIFVCFVVNRYLSP